MATRHQVALAALELACKLAERPRGKLNAGQYYVLQNIAGQFQRERGIAFLALPSTKRRECADWLMDVARQLLRGPGLRDFIKG